MNILFYSDIHISLNSIKECNSIFGEILDLCNKYKIDKIISLGDTFDRLTPNGLELDCLSTFINSLNKPLILIVATSHESANDSISSMLHFSILKKTVSTMKEFKDGSDLFCGHFIVNGAKKDFGATVTQKELSEKYRFSFLGHQHTFERLGNVYQLGSVRFVNFDEWQDKKVVAIITDYKGPNEKLEFVELKSPIKMIQIELKANNNNELEQKIGQKDQNLPSKSPVEPFLKRKRGRPRKRPLEPSSCQTQGESRGNSYDFGSICHYLDNLDPNTKVKVIIKDFSSYKQFVNIEDKYKQKFVRFMRVNDFSLISEIGDNKNKKQVSLKESFDEFVKEKNVNSEISDVIKKEIT